ncbi:hypothetical protein [Segetibacter aerophilus]|uniref:Uncharacterized protein n=1 Tax=Segetibacter aerophilus TaxID=670293 RepID=A0A512BIY4_9BACT|nr:hypothetical protein [Segetibacter aerophilus]GEO11913.1 hypothetical protein SAE01_44090 [Segetibacter aerophilus]
MMQDLKKELHKIIDSIEDEQTLNLLKEDLAAYALESSTDGLTSKQLEELDMALKEANDETGLQDWKSFKSELDNKWKEA